MKNDIITDSHLFTFPSGGSDSNRSKFTLEIRNPHIVSLSAYVVPSTTTVLVFRFLSNGLPVIPQNGWLYNANIGIKDLEVDRKLQGPPFEMEIEGWNPGGSNEDLAVIVVSSTGSAYAGEQRLINITGNIFELLRSWKGKEK